MDAFSNLSDVSLEESLTILAARERDATVDLIGCLAEYDLRRLYLAAGYSSLFAFCTQVLHLSEHAAYGRIEAARAARRCPGILEHLAQGAVTLTTICLLAPLLTPENCSELIARARHKSKREVEHLVATLRPAPDVASTIRKLPAPRAELKEPLAQVIPGASVSEARMGTDKCSDGCDSPRSAVVPLLLDVVPDAAPDQYAGRVMSPSLMTRQHASRAEIRPLAPERYRLQVTLSRETHDKLRHAQDLLRHVVRDGDPAAVLDKALTLLVEDLERRKLAMSRTRRTRPAGVPQSHSRHVPAAVRRAVWTRDGGQCAFTGTHGRCQERGYLEFHHRKPFASGGTADVANIELRCRAHNVFEAERDFECDLPARG
jgi:5-methylcytosine-specific restriction endonuclease McrA